MTPAAISTRTVVIIRHAEAQKTVESVHGGRGTPLTAQGSADCEKIGAFLQERYAGRTGRVLLVGAPAPQVRETGELLGRILSIPYLVDLRYNGLNMGALGGLSDAEATARYPEVMERLSAWRRGRVRVEEIGIPGGEPISAFLTRLRSALSDSLSQGHELLIIVGTRSVGIGLTNVLLEHSVLAGEPYKRFRFDPGSVTAISFNAVGWGALDTLNRTDFLDRVLEYPDD